MKSYIIRVIASVLAAAMLFMTLAACSGGKDNTETPDDEQPGFVLMPEIISLAELSQTVGNIENIVFSNGVMYFTVAQYKHDGSLFSRTAIYSMNFDGDSFTSLTELQHYTPSQPPYEAEGGGVKITAIHIDDNNNLWVVEHGEFFSYDFSDNLDLSETKNDEIQGFQVALKPCIYLRKLDSDGTELLSVDLGDLLEARERDIRKIVTGSDGNVYLNTYFSVINFDNDGRLMHSFNEYGLIQELLRLSDDTIAFRGSQNGQKMLWVIGIDKNAPGNSITLPQNIQAVFPGGDDHLYLFSDGTDLYGIKADSEPGSEVRLLNWTDSGIPSYNVVNISFLPDGRMMITTETSGNLEIVVLNVIPITEQIEKRY